MGSLKTWFVLRKYVYLGEGGYIFILFVCLLARLRKNCSTDFHKLRRKGGTWAAEETDFAGNPVHVTLGLWLQLGRDTAILRMGTLCYPVFA